MSQGNKLTWELRKFRKRGKLAEGETRMTVEENVVSLQGVE